MKIDKYFTCVCGKKNRIHWLGKAEFSRGEFPICVGSSECKKCNTIKEHHLGTLDAIKDFTSIMENMKGADDGNTFH